VKRIRNSKNVKNPKCDIFYELFKQEEIIFIRLGKEYESKNESMEAMKIARIICDFF